MGKKLIWLLGDHLVERESRFFKIYIEIQDARSILHVVAG